MMPPAEHASPSPYEVIIVLGAAVWPNAEPSPALRRRIGHAVSLFHRGVGKRLLLTGGLGASPPTEAEVMERLALEAGVPEHCIVLEDQATSTLTSAIFCTRLCQDYGWSRVLVVTDAYHLPRALLAFWGVGLRAAGSAARSGPSLRYKRKLWYAWGREFVACCWYLVRLCSWRLWQR